jgi:mannose-6-phosphate isomerase-like protein (cupin superfamily)
VRAGLNAQARMMRVAPGAQSEPVMHLTAETLIVIEDGTLVMMTNGAEMSLAGGQVARVAPGQFFAWRNNDRRTAHFLVKTAAPAQHCTACRVTFSIAAA